MACRSDIRGFDACPFTSRSCDLTSDLSDPIHARTIILARSRDVIRDVQGHASRPSICH